MNGLDDEQFQKLLGFTLPEENFQSQVPQLQQGLLGVISKGKDAANQMGQQAAQAASQAPNSLLEQRRAQTSAANQQQQRAGSLLGKIASLFIPGGGLLGWLKGRI